MMPDDRQRPDPDVLLAQVQASASRAAGGRLRIYFGATARGGKTSALVAAPRKLQAGGTQPRVWIVE
jgi:two-component system sensor histidine kinase KdpD